jgi:hypothetical protein
MMNTFLGEHFVEGPDGIHYGEGSLYLYRKKIQKEKKNEKLLNLIIFSSPISSFFLMIASCQGPIQEECGGFGHTPLQKKCPLFPITNECFRIPYLH